MFSPVEDVQKVTDIRHCGHFVVLLEVVQYCVRIPSSILPRESNSTVLEVY